MRVKTVLSKLLGLCAVVVICGWELTVSAGDGGRPKLVVRVRLRTAGGDGAVVARWWRRGMTAVPVNGGGVMSMSGSGLVSLSLTRPG